MSVASPLIFVPGTEIAGHLVLSTIPVEGHRPRLRARDGQGRGDDVAIAIEPSGDRATLTLARHQAQRLAALGHPAIGVPSDICLTDHGVVTVRPWYESMLSDADSTGGWSSRQLIDMVAQLAAALGTAHAAGLRHGAVSASNIGLLGNGRAVLVDASPSPQPAGLDTERLGSIGVEWLTPFGTGPCLDLALEACRSAAAGHLDAFDLAARLDLVVDAADTEATNDEVVPPPPSPRRVSVLGLAAAALVTAALGGVALAWVVSISRTPPAPAAVAPAVALCADADGSAVAGAEVITADLYGEGCAVAVTWWTSQAEAEIATGEAAGRFRLGERGDHLLLGDWDGNGTAEPALYRPTTGEMFSWSAWPVDGTPAPSTTRSDTGVVGGVPVVVVEGDQQAVRVDAGTPI